MTNPRIIIDEMKQLYEDWYAIAKTLNREPEGYTILDNDWRPIKDGGGKLQYWSPAVSSRSHLYEHGVNVFFTPQFLQNQVDTDSYLTICESFEDFPISSLFVKNEYTENGEKEADSYYTMRVVSAKTLRREYKQNVDLWVFLDGTIRKLLQDVISVPCLFIGDIVTITDVYSFPNETKYVMIRVDNPNPSKYPKWNY